MEEAEGKGVQRMKVCERQRQRRTERKEDYIYKLPVAPIAIIKQKVVEVAHRRATFYVLVKCRVHTTFFVHIYIHIYKEKEFSLLTVGEQLERLFV